jgi:hypothetical protein
MTDRGGSATKCSRTRIITVRPGCLTGKHANCHLAMCGAGRVQLLYARIPGSVGSELSRQGTERPHIDCRGPPPAQGFGPDPGERRCRGGQAGRLARCVRELQYGLGPHRRVLVLCCRPGLSEGVGRRAGCRLGITLSASRNIHQPKTIRPPGGCSGSNPQEAVRCAPSITTSHSMGHARA